MNTPTPECDSDAFVARRVVDGEYHGLYDAITLLLGESLERQRNELLLIVQDAHAALERLSDHGHADHCRWLNQAGAICDCGVDDAITTLTKLKPFLP